MGELPRAGPGVWSAVATSEARGLLLARVSLGLTAPSVLAGTGLALAAGAAPDWPDGIVAATFVAVGALVSVRQPQNPIGWLFCATAVGAGLQLLGEGYAAYATTRPGYLPGAAAAAWIASWIWIPWAMLSPTLLLLWFPSGWPHSRAGSRLARLAMLLTALGLIGQMLRPGPFDGFQELTNPVGLENRRILTESLGFGATSAVMPIILAAAILLFRRARRVGAVERGQIRWIALAAAVLAVAVAASVALNVFWPRYGDVGPALVVFALALLPVAAGIAILKHGLYDIDVVISRTLVYGALAAFITLVYVSVVVGVGRLVGAADRPNLGLSLAATAIVAVAFQPVRSRLQGLANRLVYGERLSPYE
ncbi:MAG: hypothetical protein ACRDJ4_00375, partial [Actinomycetota bacterium]